MSLVVAGVGANNVLPARVGDLLRAHWLSLKTGTPQARTLATVVVDRACDVFVLLAFLIVTYPFTPRRTWIDRVFIASVIVTAIIAAGLVATKALRRPPGARRAHASAVGPAVVAGAAALLADPGRRRRSSGAATSPSRS